MPHAPAWEFEDAKARLAELMKRAASEPQTIAIEGRDTAVVLSVAEFERLSGEHTGKIIADALARCPHDFDFERAPVLGPIRETVL